MKNLIAFILLPALVIACGETKKDETPVLKIGQDIEEIEIKKKTALALSGNDMMQFDKKELTAKTREKIILTFRHIGQLEKRIMGHNFVLLKPGTDITKFSNDAAAAGSEKDWIPENNNQVIVNTKMLGGGESDVITFDAPEPGIYDYICSFPGHSGMMRGTLTITP